MPDRFQPEFRINQSHALADIADRLGRAVGAPMVLVTELEPVRGRLAPRVFRVGGHPEGLAAIDLASAPGGDFADRDWFSCTNEFAARFPDFPRGLELDLRSYCAVSVRSRRGLLVGQLAVLDARPRRFTSTQRALLHAYALAVGEEIRRLRAGNDALEAHGSLTELLAAATQPTLVLSNDGRCVAATAGARSLLRLGDRDASSGLITSLAYEHPEFAHIYRALVPVAESPAPEQPRVVQLQLPVGDSRSVRVELVRTPLVHGDHPATLVTIRPASSTAREPVAASVFEVLAENVPGAIFSYTGHPDGSHTVHFMSRTFREIVGPKNAETISTGVSSRRLIHPEDVEAFDRAGGEARRSLSAFDHEYRIRHDDGVYRWVRALARPFRSDESGVLWHGAILDISEQKAAESRLRTTVERIPGVVFSFSQWPDGSGSMHVLSTGGATLPRPEVDATPASEYERFWSAVHPEDRESLRTGADEASKSGEPLIVRCRLLRRDHDARMVQMVARVSTHEQGRREWVGVLLDVSDRAESDDRFRTLVENLPGAAHSYTIGPDRAPGVIHLGASIEEIVGPKTGATLLRRPEHLRQLVHEEDLHRFDRAWSSSMRRLQPLDFEFRIQTDLGDYRSVRWVSHPTLGAKRVVWHGILLDVTGRREAEDRFRALADAIPGAVHSYVVRSDGTHEFLYKSPGFRTLLGPETFERFCSLEDYMNEVVHPEDRGRVRARSRSASRDLEPFDHEYRIVVDEERTKWVRSVVRPMPTAGGSMIWHAVILDVTDRREAEVRSRIHAEHLIEANQMLHLETIVSEESRLSKERTLALVHAKMREAAEALRVHASMLERTDLTPKERLAVSREMRRHAHELLRSLDGPARERLVAHYAFPGE